jgi:hypothetical protein
MMVRTGLIVVFAVGFGASAAHAQGIKMPQRSVNLIAVEPFDAGRTVTGAPYIADAITDVTQVLSDGNRIANRTSARIARDGQGRVRREQKAVAVGVLVAEAQTPIVTVNDPVAGVFFTLDLARKVAIRTTPPDRSLKVIGNGRGIGVRVPAGVPPHAPPPPPSPPGDVRTESLGTAALEGVHTEGTRTTLTIPAGAIGNHGPIEVITERWYSPELQVVVSSKRSDPRMGETIYRLTNIVRGEPSPELFEIPPDFRLEERR